MKVCSMPFPTGVAGRDKEAWTAESILSISKVGELGADILSVVRSRTANSCLRSAGDIQARENIPPPAPKPLNYGQISPCFLLTPCFIFQSLHRHQKRLLLVQLTFQEGVSLDGLVQAPLKVLQGHYRRPAHTAKFEHGMNFTAGATTTASKRRVIIHPLFSSVKILHINAVCITSKLGLQEILNVYECIFSQRGEKGCWK